MNKYSPDKSMWVTGLREQPDGSLLMVGMNLGAGNDTRIMALSAAGDVLWAVDRDSITSAIQSANTPEGGFAIIGETPYGPTGMAVYSVMKVDAAGQRVLFADLDTFPPSGLGNKAIAVALDGGFFCVHHPQDLALGQRVMMVTRLDAMGQRVWQRTYYEEDETVFNYRVLATGDGGCVLNLSAEATPHQLVKLDGSGNIEWEYSPAANVDYMFPSIAPDGNILAFGVIGNGNGGNIIEKIALDGTLLWSQDYPVLDGNLFLVSVSERPDGLLDALAARYVGNVTKLSIVRLDAVGNVLLQRTIPTANLGFGLNNIFPAYNEGVIRAMNGDLLFGGGIEYNTSFPHTAFVVRTNADGVIFPSIVSGTAFANMNNDCTYDGEVALNGTVLTFTSASDTVRTMVFEDSYYAGLQLGSYALTTKPLSPYWEASACAPTTVTIPAIGDTVIHVPFSPVINAPYIEVEGAARVRTCMPGTYTVRYCNTGTTTSGGVLILTVDELLSIDSVSVPTISIAGGVVTIVMDPLEITDCATVVVYFTAPCDPLLMDHAVCFRADALPDIVSLVPAGWDRADLAVTVVHDAVAGNVVFTVGNTGQGGMAVAGDFVIHADDGIHETHPVQLSAGQEQQFTVPANGTTWRGTIAHTPNSPIAAFATAAIEGAGSGPAGEVSRGFMDDLPQSGHYAYHHTVCMPIRNSYDPNRKSVLPEGLGEERFIDSTAVLDYMIEFQNTGNDVAYVVRIVDTLSHVLDPSTIRPGLSSHPYTFRFLASHVIEFLFEGINLPDSTSDEPGSNGFVRFRIEQNGTNTQGTVIGNEAGIYFDMNPPIITNTALLRIGWPVTTSVEHTDAENDVVLKAYPNPMGSETVISVSGHHGTPLELVMYDATGRAVVRQRAINGDRFMVARGVLGAGAYTFTVRSSDGLIGRGRLVVQ